ncbi:CAMK family protein kinase [Trichomonas vaginalis G3]|uniref:CAMK family protein kinase n=1 Tax=Trichomonas vaginalis (strain ATCC PRA-98 / G3) TaxID=412133 RepID=A2EC83_TRIV3|nr:peptidyl-threonine phosphorylation [Trichomonas vaginalis G3]EAY09760.1 CAMK family protein kinase [Trichomonas vaginalis G3]KAI5550918.1 peptidyl-threonine phosphorylation [Trichomonas vaginalis G3]|eukprot:XP_001321983.1 CAMK family protein kinase [Trichomonas vaginalis G3]
MGNCSSSSKKVKASPVSEELSNSQENASSYVSFATFFQSSSKPQICEYVFLREIGSGAMSHVYEAVHTETGEHIAAKVYNLIQLCKPTLRSEPPPIDDVQKEIKIMMSIDHSYILSLIEAIEDDATRSLIIFMPFAQYGSVQTLLDKNQMNQDEISICFLQIAYGLEELHSKNIVHRDIKNENFLCFQKDFYVLSDFSVSTILDDPDQKLEDTKGSPAFLSPEECSGEAFYPKPADVWAYGVSLYLAVYKKLPFNLDQSNACPVANTVLLVTQNLETQTLQFPENADVDSFVEDLISQCLNKDPTQRPTFTEITKHTYFRNYWAIEEKFREEDQAMVDAGADPALNNIPQAVDV